MVQNLHAAADMKECVANPEQGGTEQTEFRQEAQQCRDRTSGCGSTFAVPEAVGLEPHRHLHGKGKKVINQKSKTSGAAMSKITVGTAKVNGKVRQGIGGNRQQGGTSFRLSIQYQTKSLGGGYAKTKIPGSFPGNVSSYSRSIMDLESSSIFMESSTYSRESRSVRSRPNSVCRRTMRYR